MTSQNKKMLKFNLREVPVSNLVNLNRFCYHRELEPAALQRSVRELGILQPVWLVRRSDELQVIDGYRRIRIAHQLGIREIPAREYSREEAPQLFLQALHLNVLSGGLSLPEKLRAYQIGVHHWPQDTPLHQQIRRILELDFLPNLEDLARQVEQLPDWLVAYFHSSGIQLKMMRKVLQFPPAEYEDWLRAALRVRLKPAELVTLLEQVRDVCSRQEVSPRELWHSLKGTELLQGESTVQQKARQLKQRVEEARYPILHHIRARLEQETRQLTRTFSGRLNINWDRNLERPGVRLELHIENAEDVEHLLPHCAGSAFRQQIRKLLKTMTTLPEEVL